jgi:hypothetical protein
MMKALPPGVIANRQEPAGPKKPLLGCWWFAGLMIILGICGGLPVSGILFRDRLFAPTATTQFVQVAGQ